MWNNEHDMSKSVSDDVKPPTYMYITPQAGEAWPDMGVSGWYGIWCRFWHVVHVYSMYCTCISRRARRGRRSKRGIGMTIIIMIR